MRSRSWIPGLLLAFTLNAAASAQVVPVADAGPDVFVPCASPDGAAVTLEAVADPTSPEAPYLTYSWSAPGVTLTPTEGVSTSGVFPIGSTVVTLTVTYTDPDTSEQTRAQDELVVTVEDDTPPLICVSTSPKEIWPPNHKLVRVHVDVRVYDKCDANPTVELLSVVSSQPDNGIGDGNTTGDIQDAEIGTDDVDFLVRAERSGPDKQGRIYTATYRATDASGNYRDASAIVVVPHDRGKNGGSVDDGGSSTLPKDIKQAKKESKKLAKLQAKAAKKAAKLANKAYKAAVRASH